MPPPSPDDPGYFERLRLLAGLRRGELQALRWDDVDLANGTISIKQTWDSPVPGHPPGLCELRANFAP